MISENKKIIGITGGIGSGKSSVCEYWAALTGLPHINIDGVCAQLLEKEQVGWRLLRETLSSSFFLKDGSLDRKKLRTAIFQDESLRLRLNDLLHPLAFDRMVEVVHYNKCNTVLVDVPLLYEAGWEDFFSSCVVVYAHQAICSRRLVGRDNIGVTEAEKTIRAQLPLADKVMMADHVIDNSGNWLSTCLEIRHLAKILTPIDKI